MLMIKEPINKSVTVINGTWSGNTQNINGGILLHVIVQAATETTTFDFSITDNSSIVVKNWIGITDELNEEIYIPVEGKYTLRISNASANENFTVYLGIDES